MSRKLILGVFILGVLCPIGQVAGRHEPSPTLERVRQGKIRNFPPPHADDIELIRAAFTLFRSRALKDWPETEDIFPPPTFLITDSSEYLMGHPVPPQDFFYVGRPQNFFMLVYGRERSGPCEGSTARPLFGVPTIVMASRECTGELVTPWVFNYIRNTFRLYQLQNNELLKLSRLNLPFPDPEGRWKREFPFPYEDAEVISAFRDLAYTTHHIERTPELAARLTYLKDYFPKRDRLKKALDAASGEYSANDFFKYITWSEGIAYYVAYKLVGGVSRSNLARHIQESEDFIPFKVYQKRDLRADYIRFREISDEPIAMEDLVVFGALTFSSIESLMPPAIDWRIELLGPNVWLEEMMARARSEYP